MRKPKLKQREVLIIGGGVIGCASAWRLAAQGIKVTVLERSVPGAEASSAAAGILGAQVESHQPGPMLELALKSRGYFGSWSKLLKRETGIDIGYREGGVLRVGFVRAHLQKARQEGVWQRRRGLPVRSLNQRELRALEPQVSAELLSGLHYEGDARIDPVLFSKALHLAARQNGVQFVTSAPVLAVKSEAERVVGVALEGGEIIRAETVVVAAGSWTTQIGGLGLALDAIRPARGQIVELSHPERLLNRIVFAPNCYLVPRDDGRIIIGSTVEFVGYQKAVTAGAVAQLLTSALAVVPELKTATLSNTWSNFRPFTQDELPLLGKGASEGVILASGHYRNGILLAPVSAETVVALILGRKPPLALAPYDPVRRLIR